MSGRVKIKTLRSFLSCHPVVARVKTRWGDMDAFEHINNCNYFQYQEEARLVFFETTLRMVEPAQTEFDSDLYLSATAMGPILADTYCKFKFPVTHPDELLVGAAISATDDLSEDRYKLTHRIWSTKHGCIAAEGWSTVVNYDFQAARPVPLPSSLRAALEALGGGDSLHLLPEETED